MNRDQIFSTDKDRGITNYEKGTSLNNERRDKEKGFYRKEKVSLADVDQWFDEKILPKRKVYWFDGNPFAERSDPNGVCGQTTSFVLHEYLKDFMHEDTTDGYIMGQIIWSRFEDSNLGFLNNHTAAVMMKKMKKDKKYLHKYELKKGKLSSNMEENPQYSEQELLQLHVYDLFKERRFTLEDWISMLESLGSKHGTSNWIKLGTQIQINN